MAERSARTKAALSVPCPYCGALPGRLCTVTGRSRRGQGKVTGDLHQGRVTAAARALMGLAGAPQTPAPAAGSRPLAAGAAIGHPVLSEQPGSRVTSGAARLLARHMPENGGSDSLDYKLRKMLADDFPRLLWQHNSDSRRAHRGWPDWVIGRRAAPGEPGAVIFRELKRESEKPSPEQQDWLDALTAAGFDAGVWRPGDYFAGRIALELAALAGFRIAAARGDR